MSKKYAFLDRDGTLIFEPQDSFQVDSVDKLKILDGVIEGLQKLQEQGFLLVMVTNQNGLGGPSFPLENFERPQAALLEILKKNRIEFEQIFICSHLPEENCDCRKPKTGLVDKFFQDNDVDLAASFMCGDRDSDREFAENLGIRFVKTVTNAPNSITPS